MASSVAGRALGAVLASDAPFPGPGDNHPTARHPDVGWAATQSALQAKSHVLSLRPSPPVAPDSSTIDLTDAAPAAWRVPYAALAASQPGVPLPGQNLSAAAAAVQPAIQDDVSLALAALPVALYALRAPPLVATRSVQGDDDDVVITGTSAGTRPSAPAALCLTGHPVWYKKGCWRLLMFSCTDPQA